MARGASAALLSTGVALASHVLAGAAMPGALGIAVPLLFATSVCIVLAGKHLSAVRLGISVAVSQGIFHTLFVLGSVPAGAAVTPVTTVGGHAGHLGHEGAALASTVASTVSHTHHDPGWMWLAHAAAAAGTTCALHRGERLLARLVSLASRALARVLPRDATVVVLAARPVRKVVVEPAPTPVRALSARTGPVGRRGPPELLPV